MRKLAAMFGENFPSSGAGRDIDLTAAKFSIMEMSSNRFLFFFCFPRDYVLFFGWARACNDDKWYMLSEQMRKCENGEMSNAANNIPHT